MSNSIWKKISPEFEVIDDFISEFSVSSFHDDKRVEEYVKFFELDKICLPLEEDMIISNKEKLGSHIFEIIPNELKPYEPNYNDLVRLHYLILKRKVLTTLEFGSGYSTAIIANANRILKKHFGEWALKNIRVDNPFHVFAVEEEQRFLEITERRLGSSLNSFASLLKSSVEMILHDNRIVSIYSNLPNVSPEFIYLDGPSQYATTSVMNGFSFNSISRMPMSADILRFEFFLEPGTLILVDGRTANARFLKSYLKRNWKYEHDPIGDIHYFELNEDPLGKFNRLKLDFCLDGSWLL